MQRNSLFEFRCKGTTVFLKRRSSCYFLLRQEGDGLQSAVIARDV